MEDMMAYLKDAKAYVDSQLGNYMNSGKPYLDGLRESINYTLFSGGKRIRPIFCFIVGELFDVPREKLSSLACALEMIHTASLIMDDLPHMDSARMRRSKPANHLVYGQDVASLASVALLTRAYEVVMADDGLEAPTKVEVVRHLVDTVGMNGMVGGQFVDLKFSGPDMGHDTLDYIHIHKTASLFIATGLTAAVVGNASEAQMQAIDSYAKNLGFAFQVLDDLMDLQSSSEEAGKSTQIDRGSFARLYGAEKSRQVIQEHTDKALESVNIFGEKSTKLNFLGHILLKRRS